MMKKWEPDEAQERAARISQKLWDQLANRSDFESTAFATFEALAKECRNALEELGKSAKK